MIGLPFLAMLALPEGWEGRGLSARFMLSTRWARSEARVEARLTTSRHEVLNKRQGVRLTDSFLGFTCSS